MDKANTVVKAGKLLHVGLCLYLGAEVLRGRGLAHVSWGQEGRGRLLEGSWESNTLL